MSPLGAVPTTDGGRHWEEDKTLLETKNRTTSPRVVLLLTQDTLTYLVPVTRVRLLPSQKVTGHRVHDRIHYSIGPSNEIHP